MFSALKVKRLHAYIGVIIMMPGSYEWLIILGVALLIFGPNKLPKLGSAVGESIKNFRKGMSADEDHNKIESQSKKA